MVKIFFARSLVDQVAQFDQFLSPPPAEAPWKSNNSLVAIFIGINDVVWAPSRLPKIVEYVDAQGNSWFFVRTPSTSEIITHFSTRCIETNVTQHEFHRMLLNRYFEQVENLYEKGIRSFLFVNVPPIDRAPLFIQQGVATTRAVKASIADYNIQLLGQVKAFQSRHKDLDQITVFDSNKLFNTLLDGADTIGWVNSTGFCEAYQVSPQLI